jgi:CRP-like cAMP-binding protein
MIAPEELDRVGFLRNVGGPHLNQLAALAEQKEYPAGAEIFRQREDAPYLYFVLAGEVALDIQVSGREAVEIHRAGPGEFFGWSPVLGRRSMTGTGRATALTRMALFEVARVLELCERDSAFGMAFFREVARVLAWRLDETRQRLSHHLPRWPHGHPPQGSD